MTYKDKAYKTVQDAIKKCTVEDSPYSAVVVILNSDQNTVKVYGLNLEEEEVPMLLIEAAAEVSGHCAETHKHRTLN